MNNYNEIWPYVGALTFTSLFWLIMNFIYRKDLESWEKNEKTIRKEIIKKIIKLSKEYFPNKWCFGMLKSELNAFFNEGYEKEDLDKLRNIITLTLRFGASQTNNNEEDIEFIIKKVDKLIKKWKKGE